MLRVFPFTLKDSASEWLYDLPSESIITLAELKKAFLQKYFPTTRLNKLKKELSSIEQSPTESLYEYVERFKKLKGSCPQHGIPEDDLVLYLYEGLLDTDRSFINATNGGDILDKTPQEAMKIFEVLANASQQYGKH